MSQQMSCVRRGEIYVQFRILQHNHSTAQRDRGAKLIGSLLFGQPLTLLLLPRDQLFQADHVGDPIKLGNFITC